MLQYLKDRFDEVQDFYRVSEKELEWLIQQADKVERYKAALEKIANHGDDSRPCYPLYRIADEALEGE